MKYRILVSLCFVYYTSISQNFDLSCKDNTKQALLDFENGVIKKFVIGLVKFDNVDIDRYYRLFLKSKYNIETQFTGCTTSMETICYASTMDSLVENKYGKNFYTKLKSQIKKDYPNLSNKEKSHILHQNNDIFDFNNLEEQPDLNRNRAKSIIKRSISLEYTKNETIIFLSIDESNRIYDIEIKDIGYDHVLNPNQKEALIQTLNNKTNPVSGKIYDKSVKSITMLSI